MKFNEDNLIATARRSDGEALAPGNALTNISRRWLADIDADKFDLCHQYLLAVRLARQMTRTDVANASCVDGRPGSGVSLPTVSKMESGNYGEPGFRTMVRIARGYGIPVATLERFFR